MGDQRADQSIGAGILWILGDVLGLPFLLVLMRALGSHEKAVADEADEADEAEHVEPGSARQTLWWETDPQLRDRFGSR
ncbi:MAG: hypothetical protein QOF88_7008 [Mycobacterium sp.]|nr:hypothetical protein [Mycobacterium sp.]